MPRSQPCAVLNGRKRSRPGGDCPWKTWHRPLSCVPARQACHERPSAGDAAQVAVARSAGRIEPLFCLCQRSVLPALAHYLAAGGRKAADWYVGLAIAEVAFDDAPEAFRNVNTPEQREHMAAEEGRPDR